MDPQNLPPSPLIPNRRWQGVLNLKLLVGLLLAIILVLVVLWKPWDSQPKTSDRTITVTGEATLKAEPDEYLFTPSYDFSATDKQKALADLSKKSDEIVAKLKTLGVADSQIKSNANNYSGGGYYLPMQQELSKYTLNLEITITKKDLTQKVQDYLLTTTPVGNVTPEASFSTTKQKSLESQARDQATKEARAKADQSAKNLGFKIWKVKSVDDGNGFGAQPLGSCGRSGLCSGANLDTASPSPILSVQPGENSLDYSVTVIYFIR